MRTDVFEPTAHCVAFPTSSVREASRQRRIVWPICDRDWKMRVSMWVPTWAPNGWRWEVTVRGRESSNHAAGIQCGFKMGGRNKHLPHILNGNTWTSVLCCFRCLDQWCCRRFPFFCCHEKMPLFKHSHPEKRTQRSRRQDSALSPFFGKTRKLRQLLRGRISWVYEFVRSYE